MKSIPLRVRITALVLLFVATALLVVATLGGVSNVDESIATSTLESTSAALSQTGDQLDAYERDLRGRIVSFADDGSSEPFDDWEDLAGLNRVVFDESGTPVDLLIAGPVRFSPTYRCAVSPGAVSCDFDDQTVDGMADMPPWAVAAIERRADRVAGDVPLVVHGFVVESGGQPARLVRLEVDVFAAGEVEITTGFGDLVVIGLPLLLVGVGIITWISLGRALSPVEAMIDHVERIGAQSLDQRIPVPEADDELQHLAQTMNRMLDRLERASTSQRRFVSDASHELRSPITATGATLEVARTNPAGTDWEQVVSVVEEENRRLANLVDDLLLLARMDEEGTPATRGEQSVDLEELCLAEADRPHPAEVGVRVMAPARVRGDVSKLTRAIRNLVDNGAAHADSVVRIEVDATATTAVVRVSDDGPGIPAESSDEIFERFVRLDESRSRNGAGGSGLGLAIARQIAETHGGSLELAVPTGRGATFELKVPLSPEP